MFDGGSEQSQQKSNVFSGPLEKFAGNDVDMLKDGWQNNEANFCKERCEEEQGKGCEWKAWWQTDLLHDDNTGPLNGPLTGEGRPEMGIYKSPFLFIRYIKTTCVVHHTIVEYGYGFRSKVSDLPYNNKAGDCASQNTWELQKPYFQKHRRVEMKV